MYNCAGTLYGRVQIGHNYTCKLYVVKIIRANIASSRSCLTILCTFAILLKQHTVSLFYDLLSANCPSLLCPGEGFVGKDCSCKCPTGNPNSPIQNCASIPQSTTTTQSTTSGAVVASTTAAPPVAGSTTTPVVVPTTTQPG